MNKLTILIIILAFLSSCKTAMKASNKEYLTDVSDSLTNDLAMIYEQGYINGFSVSIVNQSGILYENGFGYADRDSGKAFTENTLINIGSITKSVVGLSLMKAQEMGLLSLDDPVNNHLTFSVVNPYFPNDPITIRQLANHTSTIVDTEYFENSCYVMTTEPDTTINPKIVIPDFFNSPKDTSLLANYMQMMLVKGNTAYSKEAFLDAQPGEQFQYSNTGSGLAALIIETASGQPFSEFAKSNVLNPLKMKSSGWSRSEVDEENISKNYASTDSAYADYHLINYPDGGLLSSAHDLSRLLIELINGYNGQGSILSAESYHTVFAKDISEDLFADIDDDVIPVINTRLDKGIFMALAPKNTIGHSGADPGVVSFMFFDSETGIGRVLIVNANINDPSQGAFTELFDIWNKLGEYEEKMGLY